MKRISWRTATMWRASVVAAAFLLVGGPVARGDVTLFYGGDFDPNNGNANGLFNGNNINATAQTYQNFIVPAGQTWTIDRMWSNNLTDGTLYSTADWSIRSGVSEGNGGTVIASATGVAATDTATGRSGFGLTEDTIQVTGLSVTLGPGTYWMQVTPDGSGSGLSYNSNTFGLNSVGSSVSDQQYFNSTTFGSNFTNADNEGVFPNFSNGVAGSLGGAVPEPGSLTLLGLGALGLMGYALRRRKQAATSVSS
jgi:PEP-CTERM motif